MEKVCIIWKLRMAKGTIWRVWNSKRWMSRRKMMTLMHSTCLSLVVQRTQRAGLESGLYLALRKADRTL